jgi:hypothetical protein
MAGGKGDTATAKTCFIIMPISTTEGMLTQYRDDTDHFQHVLDHLLIPATEKAGLKPIPPKSKGSEVIHGDIVKNIETADLVLCDMSTLNANVFFELGIRTSLNKPACLVKDNLTVKVPFDTGIVNYHTYSSALNPWELKKEIENLTSHITDTLAKSEGKNALWKYFGLSAVAEETDQKGGVEDKLQYLSLQIEGLRKQQGKMVTYDEEPHTHNEEFQAKIREVMLRRISQVLNVTGNKLINYVISDDDLSIRTTKNVDVASVRTIEDLANRYGLKLVSIKHNE